MPLSASLISYIKSVWRDTEKPFFNILRVSPCYPEAVSVFDSLRALACASMVWAIIDIHLIYFLYMVWSNAGGRRGNNGANTHSLGICFNASSFVLNT